MPNLYNCRDRCGLCRMCKHTPAPLPCTEEGRAAYRRDVLGLPNKVDRWLALMAETAQEHEYPLGDIGGFPHFGVNDNVECEVHIRQVADEDEGNGGPLDFIPTVEYRLELQISVLAESGFVLKPQDSPLICLAKYLCTGEEISRLHAPDWVLSAGVVDGLTFFQPRARMLEMIRTQIDLKTIPVGEDGPRIKAWCYTASWTHNVRTDKSIDSVTP